MLLSFFLSKNTANGTLKAHETQGNIFDKNCVSLVQRGIKAFLTRVGWANYEKMPPHPSNRPDFRPIGM
ncbi:MAG: hypothetical protein DHS20C02_10720 [Micavibrio sp.]|nr:MAG: hypothetical protein DHS20C02_10720 [Micavibrio sp.]